MTIVKKNDISDGEVWRCKLCYSRKSIRSGTIFSRSRLRPTVLMQIVYFFAVDFQIYESAKLLPEVDHKTYVDWYSFFRDVCSSALLRNPIKLGSDINSNIIEIDESLFGKKRKYHRGTGNQKYWVFGMVERNTRNSVLQLERKDRNTIIPIIEKYVEIGSTIYSDMWAAYNGLENDGFAHKAVNHSVEFRSDDGCCMNTIEGLWGGLVELRVKKMKGVIPSRLMYVLNEFMYRYRFGHENGDIFSRFLIDLSEFHPVDIIE
ncbi:uncharacterized protein LOC133189198 [Saccostrea echinata]|uniref:uncharacterized protein LOC133189198 n=1 Tax=Saccostrea echinata TaxID=191078 RepID=UPI002A81F25C|nr:uncharacterized protein LOC133189198 [Saccostrea echinata]